MPRAPGPFSTSPTTSLIIIAGTGTEVGKTWFATRLLELARARGYSVAARKPAQSYAPSDARPTDAELLGKASGEDAHEVCPAHRWYSVAMAPPMAADVLGQPNLHLSDLIGEITWPATATLRVLETAGGLLSPITHDADNLDLIRQLAPARVVLVADAGLGTINSVRLCVRALSGFEVTVYLNRYDANNELHALNRAWLREKYGIAAEHELEKCLSTCGHHATRPRVR